MRTFFLLAIAAMTSAAHAEHRPRAREAGITFGILPTGPLNAITDVSGVKVGQVTIVLGLVLLIFVLVFPRGLLPTLGALWNKALTRTDDAGRRA